MAKYQICTLIISSPIRVAISNKKFNIRTRLKPKTASSACIKSNINYLNITIKIHYKLRFLMEHTHLI